MNARGLIDSVAGIVGEAAPCASCGGSARLVNGICVSCLLHEGLQPEPPPDGESLHSLLASVDVSDSDWRIGSYDILEEIGRGGMGVIYKARQRHSRRIVALKRVLGYHADSTETLVRFRREAEAAASLDHPNILPIYEVGEADGLPFFTMKFAPGGSLQQVKHALREDPRHCVWLLARVARAVHYAHTQGILHRDLKPGNILLDGWREPMVSDFGLAKWLDASSELTRTLTIFGTPGYIAPEQASGPSAALGPAADIYSLGAILFDLLAGHPPFLGEHALAVMRQASDKTAPKLRSLVPRLDRDLETICAKCLEREPQTRYRSSAELAEDLERWLAGRTIVARPLSAPKTVFRWAKRNPILTFAAATSLLLGVGTFASYTRSSRLSTAIREVEIAQRSITVLPFEDLGGLSHDTETARAVAQHAAAALEQLGPLHVIPVSTDIAASYQAARLRDWKAIGEATGARYAVAGTIRERNGEFRVAARLIKTATGDVLASWLEDFGRPGDAGRACVAYIAPVIEQQAARAAAKLDAAVPNNVTVGGGTTNAEAISYYDRGKEFFFRYNLTDQLRAIESFRHAVALDPYYAQAHAMLAWACQLRSMTDAAAPWLEEAERAAAAALRLAPLLPDAHRAHAGVLERRGDLRTAVDSYLTAYELDPSNARAAATLGSIYHELGRPDLALWWLETATARDTRPVYADNIGNAWTALGAYDEAEKAYRTAAIFRPDLSVGALGLTRLALFRGDYDAARRQCAEAAARYAHDPQPIAMAALIEFYSRDFAAARKLYVNAAAADPKAGTQYVGAVRFVSALGYLKVLAGDTNDGVALLKEARAYDEAELASAPENSTRLFSFAATAAAMGDEPAALDALDRAIAAGWIDYHSLALDPRLDSLRSTSRFQEALTRVVTRVQAMARQQPGRELAQNRR